MPPLHLLQVRRYSGMGEALCKEAGTFCGCMSADPGADRHLESTEAEVPAYNANSEQPATMTSPGGGYSAPPPPARNRGGGRGRPGLTFDDVMSDLVTAEFQAYGGAFESFAGGAPVGCDHAQLRDFLLSNSALSSNDLDMELLKAANSDTMQMDQSSFVQLMQDHSCSDGDALGAFANISSDGQSLASEECRTGLLLFAQDKLAASYDEQRWDRLLNMVMMDAGPTVQMEQWLLYCKKVARYIRLIRYCQL